MKQKLTKKQQNTIYELIQKHLERMSNTLDDNHWYVMGSSTYQINQLIDILQNGYDTWWSFDEIIKTYSSLEV